MLRKLASFFNAVEEIQPQIPPQDPLPSTIDCKTTALELIETESCGSSFHFLTNLSEDLCDDSDVVLAAIQRHGSALLFASERLKKDPDIIEIAIQAFPCSIQYAPPPFRFNKQLFERAVASDPSCFQYAGDLRNDKDLAMLAVTGDPLTLEYLLDITGNDIDIILQAIASDRMSIG